MASNISQVTLHTSKALNIRIADIGISIEGYGDWDTAPAYRPFVASGDPDISLRLHQEIPATVGGDKVFDCPPIWALYRQNGSLVFKIFDALPGLRRTLILPPQFQRAKLCFADRSARFVDPFFGPTLELLVLNYLAKGRGVILHGCGMARKGKGVLFVGESGAGKSTLARVWDREKDVEILSDDRTIVRKRGSKFWMYGTPWHGDGAFGSPEGVRLQAVFFLRHGRENSVDQMKGSAAVSQLVTSSFPPYWDPRGMEFVLELLIEMTGEVPCQELSFKPDRGVIEFVDGLVESS
jgi:hypothetical protein